MLGAYQGGTNFVFSLLLEIGPSKMNINISIFIKEISGGVSGGKIYIFFIIRDCKWKNSEFEIDITPTIITFSFFSSSTPLQTG